MLSPYYIFLNYKYNKTTIAGESVFTEEPGVNVMSLKLSNIYSRTANLPFTTLYHYTTSPENSKSNEDCKHVLRTALCHCYPSLGVGGNDSSEVLFSRVGLVE